MNAPPTRPDIPVVPLREAATLLGYPDTPQGKEAAKSALRHAGIRSGYPRELVEWLRENRPGQGARTDLPKKDTMDMLDLSHTAAAVISRARTNSGLTAPEFDHDIATHYDSSVNGVGGQFSPLGNASHEIARERGVDPDELWQQLQPELQAYAVRCRDRKYSGWSTAARARGARITYAD